MLTKTPLPVVSQLESRRKFLGMTVESLVKRSGVSRATVHRILAGNVQSASFGNVSAVARALGLGDTFADPVCRGIFLEQQAEKQARLAVSLVQGTMGLEAQGLPQEEVDQLTMESKEQLLYGSRKKLWR